MLDTTKGIVSTIVGPNNHSLGANTYPVLWDTRKRQFQRCDELARATQAFVNVPEGYYVVLEAPAPLDKQHPTEGAINNTTPPLNFGRRVNIAGPTHFPLWPQQTAVVVAGHQLRSNQYLVARIYNDEAASEHWDAAVVRPQAGQEGETEAGQPLSVSAVPKPDRLTMGRLIVIKGTTVSFYIPPTGVEVLPQQPGMDTYVRDAITLERLEYCILLDESGNKRFMPGPDVVFPEPTETFVEVDDRVKFRAIELNEISGIHIKVIADYTEEDTAKTQRRAGDELFITGRDQAIYMPRPEHSIITYGTRQIHYAVAVPRGEGRYILHRLTGEVELVKGPVMLLPDPRTQVVVRRVLPLNMVKLLYPGNQKALEVNQALAEISQHLAPGAHFTEEALEQYGERAQAAHTRRARSQAPESVAGEQFERSTTFTPPRTITLDTKYDGAVTVNIWNGYAILVTDNVGNRRVVIGPQTVLLAYNETLMAMELSTGTPKSDDHLIQTAYLRVYNNRVSDKVQVETSDLCQIALTLSYRVNFEGSNPEHWFAVENYVKFLTDHLRSLIRNVARQHGVEVFYRDAIALVRNAVLGLPSAPGEARPGRQFDENAMRVYDVEVLDVTIENQTIAELLTRAQHTTVQATLEAVQAERELEHTKRIEAARRGVEQERAASATLRMQLEAAAVQSQLDLALKTVALEAEQVKARNQFQLDEQARLTQISDAALARQRAAEEQTLALEQRRIEQRLAELVATTEEFVKRTHALSPDLVAAIQAFGDQHFVEKVAHAVAPLTLLGGESVVEVLY